MGDFLQLALNGTIDLRVSMPVQVGPDGGIGIDVLTAVNIPQHCAPARRNDDGLPLEPVSHLGERVPDMPVIELGKLVHKGNFGSTAFKAVSNCSISVTECAA